MLKLGLGLSDRTTNFIVNECKKRKRSLLFLLIITIIGTFLELIGIGMIFPILLIKINPEIVTHNRIFRYITHAFGTTETNHFIYIAMGIMVLSFFLRNLHLVYLTYIRSKMLGEWKEDIARDLLQQYLRAPYPYVIGKTSSIMIRNVQITSAVFDRVVISIISLVSNFILIFAIVGLIAFIQPVITIVCALLLFLVIIIQNRFLKNALMNVGELANEGHHSTHEALQQSLSVIRESRLMGKSNFFIRHFISSYKKLSNAYLISQVLKTIPPLITQFLMILVICGMLLMLIMVDSEKTAFPSLGLMAMAAFRLAPRFNNIQAAFNTLHEGSKTVEKTAKEFEDIAKIVAKDDSNIAVINMQQNIKLKNVSFAYPSSKLQHVLYNVSLTINNGDFVAIMGASGAGKSTLIDIITGLLPPDTGQVFIDNAPMLEGNNQRLIRTGFVSQTQIFTNETIRNNIALGVEKNDICDNTINDVLKMVGLDKLISELPEGLETMLGDNAARLSGGQRQRLAIARALYMKPKLLVMDEPTSALDPETEKQILVLLQEMNKLVTIILITHRASMTTHCNKVFFIDEGEVVEAENIKELASKNESYRFTYE